MNLRSGCFDNKFDARRSRARGIAPSLIPPGHSADTR